MHSVKISILEYQEQSNTIVIGISSDDEGPLLGKTYQFAYQLQDLNATTVDDVLKTIARSAIGFLNQENEKFLMIENTQFINEIKSTVGQTYSFTSEQLEQIDENQPLENVIIT